MFTTQDPDTINDINIEEMHENLDMAITTGRYDDAEKIMSRIRSIFGDEVAEKIASHYSPYIQAKIGEHDPNDV